MSNKISDFNPAIQEQIRQQLLTAKQHNSPQIGEYSFNETNRSVPGPKPQPPVRNEPLAADEGKKKRSKRAVVRFTSYRRRLIKDRTNIEGGIKFIEDSLVYAGIILGDSEAEVIRTVKQVKVETREEECTTIEIL